MLTKMYVRHKTVFWSLLLSGLFLLPAIDNFSNSEFILAWSLWFLLSYLIFRVQAPPETHQIIAALAVFPVSFLAPYVGLEIVSGEADMLPLYFSVIFCILITGACFHTVWRSMSHS